MLVDSIIKFKTFVTFFFYFEFENNVKKKSSQIIFDISFFRRTIDEKCIDFSVFDHSKKSVNDFCFENSRRFEFDVSINIIQRFFLMSYCSHFFHECTIVFAFEQMCYRIDQSLVNNFKQLIDFQNVI